MKKYFIFFVASFLFILASCNNKATQNESCLNDSVAALNTSVKGDAVSQNIEKPRDTYIKEQARHDRDPFYLLGKAFSKTKTQLLVTIELMLVLLFILSLILYLAEHFAQPTVYKHFPTSMLWTFVKCIQDPGEMAPPKPITVLGRVVANVIGLIGVAIFAIPAGIVSSGFIGAMDEERHEIQLYENTERIIHSFKFNWDQHHTGLYYVPRYLDVNSILSRKFLTEDEIIKAVEHSDCFHLYNIANAVNRQYQAEDKLVVINYFRNTPYGTCIDRGSKVTIVSTSGFSEPLTSWLAYHIAKLGGFNYVAKEVETDPDNPTTYYNITDENACPNLHMFLDDIDRLSAQPDSWVIPILGAEGLKDRPTQLHFCYNTTKHDDSYNDPKSRISDYATFDKMYKKMDTVMAEKYDLHADKNEWYAVQPINVAYHLNAKNVFTLRVECSVYVFDSRFLEIIKTIAEVFNYAFEPDVEKQIPPEMVTRRIGHDFGMADYIN